MVGLELQEDAIPDPLNLGFVEPIEANLQALEDEVLSVFSRDQLITPNLLLKNGETTINAGLKANDWPTLAECRGKIMFTLQGNRITEGNRYPGNLGPLSDRIFFPDSNPDSDNGAYVVRNDPVNSQRDITQLVQDNYLVRTRADADTVEARKGAVDRRTLAIASGAQFVSTDYPQPMSVPNIDFGSGYAVNLLARCNPVTGPANCQVTLLTQAPVTPQNITVPRAPTDGGLGLGDSLSGGIKLDQVLIALAEAIQGNDSSTWTDVENGYVALAYEPSSSAQTMHNMPRIASSSEFNDNSDYIMGLVYIAIPFLVIGMIGGTDVTSFGMKLIVV
ncbi:hypothetical protein SARC_04397 [Sphaeroforma arctica JP610]|uniref:Uncharacterized protein n=1 Tax=Sphaeroforma arctica JP610 TaxID=667725 RepID=A0A0L0G2N4_9EUKA|nr:hypothetical protein SARC_04397 [Sphaeroforma arctica JP610]KNC83345.1 hypothetical protein SARC_04397 [Sphaeroforma arctica JP610]|eukprot:XP_014157247.1 hypothetical protein SARC_04397 [Sphaeroforma arctica JP610]